MIVIKTSLGTLTIELAHEKAPESVNNFLGYVDAGFYDGTIFHRVIDGFMIQGGGFTEDMEQKTTTTPIVNEANNGLKNDRGSLAMARTSDPNSATSQFFVNVVDNEGLNHPQPDGHGYAVFANVVEGMEVVDKIKKVKTVVKNGHHDVPAEAVTIISVQRVADES